MSKNFEICKIVGLGSIFRKNETKKKTLVKNQLVSANWWVQAPVCSDVSIQILLKLAWIVMFMIQAYFRGTDMELWEHNFAVSPHQFASTG